MSNSLIDRVLKSGRKVKIKELSLDAIALVRASLKTSRILLGRLPIRRDALPTLETEPSIPLRSVWAIGAVLSM